MNRILRTAFILFACIFLAVPPSLAVSAEKRELPGEALVTLKSGEVTFSAATSGAEIGSLTSRVAAAVSAEPVKTYSALSRSSGVVIALIRSESKTSEEIIAELSGNPDVLSASPNRKIRAMSVVPDDEHYSYQWGMRMIRAPDAWELTCGTKNDYIAVMDTGVNQTHLDLAGNIDTRYSRNFTGGAVNDISDGNGHGTHICGIIGAVGDNGRGVAGVNWTTNIIMLKVMDKNGEGYISWVIEAIDYLIGLMDDGSGPGLRIPAINISFGGYENLTPDEYVGSPEWLAYKALSDTGKPVIVTAAGNEGMETGAPALYKATKGAAVIVDKGQTIYPASLVGIDGMIVVGSLGSDKKAGYFSNWSDKYVHAAAPGGGSRAAGAYGILSTIPSNSYDFKEGTSMAAAFVTGSIALLASSPQYRDLNAAQLKKHLLVTADAEINPYSDAVTIDQPTPGLPINPQRSGSTKLSRFGLIDVGKAVRIPFDNSPVLIKDIELRAPGTVLSPGEGMYVAADIEPLEATSRHMIWRSSDNTVASVDGGGYVNALSPGIVTITSSAVDGTSSASFTLQVRTGSSAPVSDSGGGCVSGVGLFAIVSFIIIGPNKWHRQIKL